MLTTSVERLEGVTVKLTITVPAADVDAAINSTYKRLGKKYRFPGFRPGKAPRAILDQQIGRDYILGEATEELVNSSYPRALDQEDLRPIESPEIEELDTVVEGQDFTFGAEIDIRPELEISGTDGLSVALPDREPTDAEIDVWVEDARERFASLEPVEDRGVEANDFALISFVGMVDGQPYEGNEVDKYLYELGRGLMPEEFDAGMIGKKAGEEAHVEFTVPDTTSNPDFAGKTATFDVTVHEIKAKVLPQIDDEFAANVGGFENVDEMREDLKGRLGVQKALAHDRLKERRVREAIAGRLEGEVPEAMISSRQSSMTRDFMQMLEEQGMNLTDYVASAGIDMDTFEKDMAEQAEKSIREDLALEALFKAVGMEVTDEDRAAEFENIAGAAQTTPEEARKRWEDMGLLGVLNDQIMHRKAQEWLMENVEVTIEEPAESESEQE